MPNATRLYRAEDDIDRIVDKLLADPASADEMKSQLRRRIGGGNVVNVVPRRRPAPVIRDEVEEMWDNVPV